MKVRKLIALLESNDWYLARTKGSHRQFRHPSNPKVITVPGKMSDEIPIGTLKNILKKAELKQGDN